ncbi:T9SS type A sorting domain-containing protein, partial [candidate division WOR-3 bacterium]|nr:T9SS type A sorting domain-containing protein [candidate division WOR-3 bacterium]
GEVNPGETINLPTWVMNSGGVVANNVYGFLTTSDTYVNVTQDSSYFGTIPAGDSALGAPDYVFDVASNCPDMHSINLNLTTYDQAGTTWVSPFVITVYAPDIIYTAHTIDDAGASNPNGYLDPGETADLLVTLKNDGHLDAANISATLNTSDTYIQINDGSAVYGDIAVGDSVTNNSDPFNITADASTPQGHTASFTLVVTGDYGFVDTTSFDIGVGLPGVPYADHNIGNVVFTVTSQGACGFMDGSQSQGTGFKYPYSGANSLFIGSVWVGNSASYVVNTDYEAEGSPDWVVTTVPDGLVRMGGTFYSNQDGWAMYDDAGMSSPKDIVVTQNSWAWANDPYNDFVIMVYTVENNGSSAVNGLYVGHFMDVDVTGYYDYAGTSASLRLAYVYDPGDIYVGTKLLDPIVATNLYILDNATYVYPNAHVLDSDKIQMLNGTYTATSGSNDDYSIVVSSGPFNVNPGECQLVAFAIIGGDNQSDLENNAISAQQKYDSLNVGIKEVVGNTLPLKYYLATAYPNPVKNGAFIEYQIPRKSNVTLKVYDVSGRLVNVLVDGVIDAGYHNIGLNTKGYASGIYFYRLVAGGKTFTKKLIVVK